MLMFVVYLMTLAPSITWQHGGADSGELAAAITELGIAHPPGYPTYMLLGRVWAILPLGGDIAHRLNILSAFSAAMSGVITALIIFRVFTVGGKSRNYRIFGAIFGGLLLMLAPLTWSQATITEVYAPGLLICSVIIYVFLRKTDIASKTIFWGGLLIGIGTGVLPQIVLFLPVAALLILWRKIGLKSQVSIWYLTGIFGAGIFLGGSVFAYLPLRALAHPVANWGNPETLSNWWTLVTAQQYQHLTTSLDASWFIRLNQSLTQLALQISLPGMLLALLGVSWLWLQSPPDTVFLVLFGVGTLLFRVSYSAAGNIVYLLPLLLVLAIFAGGGLCVVLTWGRRYFSMSALVPLGIVLLASLIWRGTHTFPLMDISNDRQAYNFSRDILSELPADAVIVTDRDETTFSLWYQKSLSVRPDITVVDNRLIHYDWYIQNLRYQNVSLRPDMLQADKINIPSRPVFYLITSENNSAIGFSYEMRAETN